MEILVSFLISVAAGIVTYYICNPNNNKIPTFHSYIKNPQKTDCFLGILFCKISIKRREASYEYFKFVSKPKTFN